jgi:hypothetical protein
MSARLPARLSRTRCQLSFWLLGMTGFAAVREDLGMVALG